MGGFGVEWVLQIARILWGMLEQSTYRRLSHRQASAAEVGVGGVWDLAQGLGPRYWAVQLWDWTPLGLLCAVTICVSENH